MDPRTQETRRELLMAALVCFARHGFEGTSLRMIAQRAGRSLSLIGHHFGGKEGLYLEVFRFLFARRVLALADAGGVEPRDGAEAVRLLREQIHAFYLEAFSEAPAGDEFRDAGRLLVLMEMRDPRPEVLALLQRKFEPWVARVTACIRVLRPDLGPGEVVFVGRAIMGQITSRSLMEGFSTAIWGRHPLDARRGAERMPEFCLRGLGVPPEHLGQGPHGHVAPVAPGITGVPPGPCKG